MMSGRDKEKGDKNEGAQIPGQFRMACELGAALYGHSERGKRVDGCPGSTRSPAQSSVAQSDG